MHRAARSVTFYHMRRYVCARAHASSLLSCVISLRPVLLLYASVPSSACECGVWGVERAGAGNFSRYVASCVVLGPLFVVVSAWWCCKFCELRETVANVTVDALEGQAPRSLTARLMGPLLSGRKRPQPRQQAQQKAAPVAKTGKFFSQSWCTYDGVERGPTLSGRGV